MIKPCWFDHFQVDGSNRPGTGGLQKAETTFKATAAYSGECQAVLPADQFSFLSQLRYFVGLDCGQAGEDQCEQAQIEIAELP